MSQLGKVFQSRRSGFGVCVRLLPLHLRRLAPVSVPAIGIWGLRPQVDVDELCRLLVSVPAIGIWGLRRGTLPGSIGWTIVSVPAIGIWGLRPVGATWLNCTPKCFSPGDRDLGFASVLTGFTFGLNQVLFQSRRSGFGVCVRSKSFPTMPKLIISVPAIGIWGLRRLWSSASKKN